MGSKRKPPDPPDLDWELGETQDIYAELRAWTDSQATYADEQDTYLQGVRDEVMGVQLPAMQDMYDWAQQDRQRYEDVFIPQQDKFIEMANTYSSDEEIARQRAAASQDINAAYDAQKEAQLRQLESYGIDPSQARYAGLDQSARLNQAAASAMAQNTAAERTKAIGRELQGQAINMGAGLPGQAMAGAGNASNIGASAQSGAAGITALGLQGKQSVLPGYTMGLGAVGQSGDIKNVDFGNKMNHFGAKEAQGSQLGGLGAMFGNLAGFGAGWGADWMPSPGKAGGAEGGSIEAPGGPTSDSGVIRISNGEYVLPAEVVNNMGANVLDKFVEKQTGVLPTRKQAVPVGV